MGVSPWTRAILERALPAYEIGDELGRGAHGAVVAARHRALGREVAVKLLAPGLAADEDTVARFLAEARLLASLDHPHVVPIYDFIEAEGSCLLVMERLTGGTVKTRMGSGRLSVAAACAVVIATCAALRHAHDKGVLHRDIKPANLLLSADGVVKVADFGIAKLVGEGEAITRTGAVMGTLAYMAPEQVRGDAPSPAVDVYATGTVLYELLCGQLPFPHVADAMARLYQRVNDDPVPLLARAPGLPAAFGEVTARAICRDRAERYQTPDELAAAVNEAAAREWGPQWSGDTGILLRVPLPSRDTTGTPAAPTRPPPVRQRPAASGTWPTGTPTEGVRPSAGLLERSAELERARGLARAAADGDGSLLLIESPAGLGKSTLLRALRDVARSSGLRPLRAAGVELEDGFPFSVVLQLYTRPVRALGAHEREELFAGPAALLGSLFGGSAPETRPDVESVVQGLYWLAVELADREPLALLIDDAHWADAPSMRALAYLARRVEDLPIMLVIAARPAESGPARPYLERIAADPAAIVAGLSPLSEPATAALVRARLSGADEPFCAACHEATAGNPLLLSELLLAAGDQQIPATVAGVDRIRQLGSRTLARSIKLRLSQLGDEAVGLARAVAVLGARAPLHRAAAVAGIAPEAAATTADQLADNHVLAVGRPLRFMHPIVRTALLESLAPSERATLHARAARLLDEEGAEALELAGHLLACEPTGNPWVVERLRAAADQVLGRAAPATAADYLQRALAEPPPAGERGAVLLELGRAQARIPSEQAIASLREAAQELTDPSQRVPAVRELMLAYGLAKRAQEGIEAGRAALAELGDADPGLAAHLECAIMDVARLSGMRDVVLETLASLKRLRGAVEIDWVVDAQEGLELAAAGESRDEAAALAERALAGRAASRFQHDYDAAQGMSIMALLWADAFDRVRAHAADMVAGGRRHGDLHSVALGHGYIAMAHWRAGDLAAAEADSLQSQAALSGWELIFLIGLTTLADVRIDQGELDAAAALLERCGIPEAPPYIPSELLGVMARGRLHAARGEWQAARDDFLAVGEARLADGRPNPAVDPWRSSAALAELELGDRVAAHALAYEELERARAFGAPRALGIALRSAGLIAGGERGLELLREAVGVLEGSPARLEHARALTDLGVALRRADDVAAARDALRPARELATRCGATAVAERAREELLAAGARPRRLTLDGIEALTPSERRVCELAAQGLSNRQVAQELFVTAKEVEDHLASSYAKLGIDHAQELTGLMAGA